MTQFSILRLRQITQSAGHFTRGAIQSSQGGELVTGKPVLAAAFTLAFVCHAEEGMWTFDNPPSKAIQEKYNFALTPQWLEHVRLSSVRLNDGGSGSFVSPHGLLLTNHHVARGQLQKNSSAARDFIKDGFYARTEAEEMKSPDLEVNVLVSLEDVTARVQDALKNATTPEAAFAARREIIARIGREGQEATKLRSDVVTLYQGGEYWLYRYKRYTDVRLVFAPEEQAAFYGGDPDNFTYPRYDLDMALFRVYENGKPLETAQYLKWNPKGAADGDLVFVSGHPGSTSRLHTLAQLESQRDSSLPSLLKLINSRLDVLGKYSALGAEQSRQASDQVFSLENSRKAILGQLKGLRDEQVMAAKRADEERFKAAVNERPEMRDAYGSAWDDIAAAESKAVTRTKEQYFHGMASTLADLSRQIVEYVAEIKKPDGQRLPGYHDSQLESTRLEMFSPAPIYPEFEIARMTGALALDLAELGPDDPFVKTILEGRTPAAAADTLIKGSRLADPAVRKQLVEGGETAVAASTDSLIVLARRLDPQRREYRKWMEDNVQSVEARAGEKIGKARFAVFGKTTYPDATFTLRLSYGQVKGYPMNGTVAPPETTFYGLYDRAASFNYKGPFALSSRFLENRGKLELRTAFNFVTTNDIIGGNSGSPIISKEGEIVGLVFDGNIESLVGDFVYEPTANRTVAVHTAAMTEALRKLYGAQKLLDELLVGKAGK